MVKRNPLHLIDQVLAAINNTISCLTLCLIHQQLRPKLKVANEN